MTKVKIDPGPCDFKAVVTAQMNDDEMCDDETNWQTHEREIRY